LEVLLVGHRGVQVFDLALAVLLGVHLLVVDVAMAGPLACVWLEWRDTNRRDALAGRAGLALARLSNWALTAGIALGIILLAAQWARGDSAYFAAVRDVPASRLWFAGAELLFYLACMGAYVGLWNRWRTWRMPHRALAIAAATNLMIHFPALFAIVSVTSQRPELLGQPLGSEGYRRMLLDPEVLSRVLHVWMAALAVTGVAVMVVVGRLAAGEPGNSTAPSLVRRGALLALVATLLQLPSGFWLAIEMPEPSRQPLLGGDPLATGLFVTALVLTLALTHRLVAIALGDDAQKQVTRCVTAMLLVVMLMVAARCRLFDSAHAPSARHSDAIPIAHLRITRHPVQ
jgi:hypothetical protein